MKNTIMNAPKQNIEKKKQPKELLLAMLTDAGLLKPLYYFLVSSAVIGASVGVSKVVLESNQEQKRKKIQVTLEPPTEKKMEQRLNNAVQPQEALERTTEARPEPVKQNENRLEPFIARLDAAARDGRGLYDLLKEAKAQLTPPELKDLISHLVEITDQNYPLPTDGMTEEEKDLFFQNDLSNELNRRRTVAERFAESLATDLVLDDPVLTGFLLDAMEQKERIEQIKIPLQENQKAYHRLRGNMIGYLCSQILRYGSSTRRNYRTPQQIIDQLKKHLIHLETLDFENLEEYRKMVENVGG